MEERRKPDAAGAARAAGMDVAERKKCGNTEQLLSVRRVQFTDGAAAGQRALAVTNRSLELLILEGRCLDILYVRHNGVNLSFMSRNGFNAGSGEFASRFEGGFLYTCGLENISASRSGAPLHGSLHLLPAQNVRAERCGDTVVVSGDVLDTALFGRHLVLHRSLRVGADSLDICDRLENAGYRPEEYALLYHCNLGYPMLDACTRVRMDARSSEGVTEKAERNKARAFVMAEPADNEEEEVFYHTLAEGKVEVENPILKKKVTFAYDTDVFPHLVEWKSMASGDYALGIEPSTTRFFRHFSPRVLQAGESAELKLQIEIQ